jgi:hypothetical protein
VDKVILVLHIQDSLLWYRILVHLLVPGAIFDLWQQEILT